MCSPDSHYPGRLRPGTSSPAGTDAGTEASAAGTAGSKEGETILTYAVMEEPETLDPTLNNYSTSSTFLQNMFCGLFQLEADGSLSNAMCDTYEVSEDGLTYTFTLKDGLKWSDGSDLTAGDFEYSWKRVLNPDTASPAAWELHYLKGGEEYNTQGGSAQDVGVKAVDDKTLEVTLKAPTPYFLYLTASSNFSLSSRRWWRDRNPGPNPRIPMCATVHLPWRR